MLKSISISGFKHILSTYELEFDKITHITGENGTGKTTILQAIELLLTGEIFDTASGKRHDLLGFFYSDIGREMKISGVFADGKSIARHFIKSEVGKKFTLSQSLSVYPVPLDKNEMEIKGLTNLEKYLKEYLGTMLPFGFRNFFELSDNAQMNYLFKLFGSQEINYESLYRSIYESSEINIADLVPVVRGEGFELIYGIENQLEALFKNRNAEVSAGKKTVRKLADILSEREKISSDVQELDRKFVLVSKKISDASGSIRDIKNLKEKIQYFKKEFSDIQDKWTGWNLDDTNKKIENFRKELDQIPYLALKETDKARFDFLSGLKIQMYSNCICPLCLKRFSPDEVLAIDDNWDSLLKSSMPSREEFKKQEENLIYRNKLKSEIEFLLEKTRDYEYDRRSIEKYSKQISLLLKTAESKNEEVEKLMGKYKTSSEKDSVEILRTLEIQYDDLKRTIAEKNNQIGILQAQERSYNDFLAAQEKLEKIKRVREALQGIKNHLVEKAFKKFIDSVNIDFQNLETIGKKIDPNPIVFDVKFNDERGNPAFRPGLRPLKPPTPYSDGFVDYRSLNESHKTKIFLSFILNIPKKGLNVFLLDNMEHLSPGYVASFYKHLPEISEKYDNIVTTSTHPIKPMPKVEIKIIDLGWKDGKSQSSAK